MKLLLLGMAEQTKKEIFWQAPEFIHYPKSVFWFIVVGIVGLAFIIFFLFRRDFLTAVLFLLLTVLMIYFSRQKPRTLTVTLDNRGLKMNDVRVSYSQLKNFWMLYDPPEVKTLNFETTAYLNRYLTIQLADQDPVEVRKFLLGHLPEDLDKEEGVGDKLSRKIGF